MYLMFVEFKIYISLKQIHCQKMPVISLQNSKFTYLSNHLLLLKHHNHVCRIQNLHISQTKNFFAFLLCRFVEFKIYISLKLPHSLAPVFSMFVEFKIYISLKQILLYFLYQPLFVEFKIYISLKHLLLNSILTLGLQNSKFTYLSNR